MNTPDNKTYTVYSNQELIQDADSLKTQLIIAAPPPPST